MATRTPLYLDFINGEIKEFDSGDSMDFAAIRGIAPAGGSTGQVLKKTTDADYNYDWATPSSGSLTITSFEQNLGSVPTWRGKFTVVDAGVSSTSKIQIWQRFAELTGKGTRADENEMDYLDCHAEAGTGQFTVYWQTKPMLSMKRLIRDGNTVRSPVATLAPYQDAYMYKPVRLGKVKGNFRFNYIYS